jgi:hypothetical protein
MINLTEFYYSDSMPTVDQIIHSELIMFTINKDDIVSKNYTRVNELHKLLLKARTKGKEKVLMLFGGYDHDPREIYLIDEIKTYVRELIKSKPDLFYWLTSFDNNKQMVLLCAVDNMTMMKHKDSTMVANSFEISEELYKNIIYGTSMMCEMIGESPAEFERIISSLTQPQ